MSSGARHWGRLIVGFMSGQILIQIINLATGLLILRLLSLQEYAIYTLASLLLSAAAIGSDMGVSQGVVSIGATRRGDMTALGRLIASATFMRRVSFAFLVPVVAVLAYFVLGPIGIDTTISIALVILATVWIQQAVTVRTSLLNIHHDSKGLTWTGLSGGITRFLAVLGLCTVAPYAITALLVNFIGVCVSAFVIGRMGGKYLEPAVSHTRQYQEELRKFIVPLIPGVVYFLLQGQISTYLLALGSNMNAVAEVGALGRLGQILGLLTLLNGYFIQPYFARISDKRMFARRAVQAASAAVAILALLTLSVYSFPKLWLLILGPNYQGLSDELLLAMAGAELSILGGLVYTLVIATRVTHGQWWQIVVGLSAQFAFILFVGVRTTSDALLLNLIPSATYLVLQCTLLTVTLINWDEIRQDRNPS